MKLENLGYLLVGITIAGLTTGTANTFINLPSWVGPLSSIISLVGFFCLVILAIELMPRP